MKSTMLALAMFTSGCGGLPQLMQTLESLRTDCYGLLDRAQRAGLDASRGKELRAECDAATEDAKARVGRAVDRLIEELNKLGVGV